MYTLDELSAFKIQQPADTYIYDIASVGSSLATISSDGRLRLLDPLALDMRPMSEIRTLHSDITSLKVPEGQENVVCTAGRDGWVLMWDVRTGQRIGAVASEQSVPILSLACSSASNSIAAGTELANYQASVLIWDTRNLSAPRVQYIESHSDDVTELQYHPLDATILLSGSTDGLINLYNTTITLEEDALHQTLNHGSSIHHAGFLSSTGLSIFGLSHDETFSIYPTLTDPDPDAELPDPQVFGDLREGLGCEYVINVLRRPDGGAVVGTGSHSGGKMEFVQLRREGEGELSWRFEGEERVGLVGAHGEEIVRSFCFLDQHKMVLSCGEDGQVKAWGSG